MRRVTIITPVYNEQDSLPLYLNAVQETLFSSSDILFDVLLVDDGSTDDSWAHIKRASATDIRIRGLRLSRNFGSHIALCAGFDAAQADAVVILACDLQDPPDTVLDLVRKWRAGADIVWGHRRVRDETLWRRLASGLFGSAIRRFAMPRGSRFTTGSFLLADRKVVDAVRNMREHARVTFAMVAWTGFRQEVVHYDRRRRSAGQSGWSFWQMVRSMYDAFVGFSLLPIRLATAIGAAVSLSSVLLAVYLITRWWLGLPPPGYTSTMLLVTIFFGIQFLLTGLIGEYLHRIYIEAMQRPLYFVSDQCGTSETSATRSSEH